MRVLLLLILVISSLFAEITVELKKGWQLVGVPTYLENMSAFNSKNVEIVWGFDGESQSWKGYSPNEELDQKLIEKEIALLSSLEPWQAVWVFSKEAWVLHVKDSDVPIQARNNSIILYKGWNLIEIPQDSVISDKFFGDALLWKYSADSQWLSNDESLNFPSIETIAVSEGLWVKSESRQEIKVDEELSKLNTFKSEESMLSYIRTMLKLNTYRYYDYAIAENDISVGEISSPTAPADDANKDATSTNLQEEGVDESDILKNDGTHIFSVDNVNDKIIITSFDKIAIQDYKPLYEIDMSEKNIVAMYLQDKRLSVISRKSYNYVYEKSVDNGDIPLVEESSKRSIMPYYGNSTQQFTLDIFDVSNLDAIANIGSFNIDGNYQDSRLIDGKLFLISQFYPNIQYKYLKVYVDTPCSKLNPKETYGNCTGSMICEDGVDCKVVQECDYGEDYQAWQDNLCNQYSYDATGAWKYDYDNPEIVSENLIPSISDRSASSALVTPAKFYAPNKLDQRANITSISRFDITSAAIEDTLSFLGDTHTYYASTSSLYLVSSQYPYYFDYSYSKTQQTIYKFSLGDTFAYKARGKVDGRMLNQFSMSEKNEYLRVATTVGEAWWNVETINSVYTLKEENEKLQIKGTLAGLGKEGETIKAVRFMGDRGFVVTFRQSDPLYTLDMSDPLNPLKVGELSIPGFSSYLHIIDENRVLSIGRDADDKGRALALQVSLFDISDFANPKLATKITIGDASLHSSTHSEAEYNHKAFVYRASDKIFGFPFTDYLAGSYTENFGVYQIDGMSINALHTITTSTPENWGNSARGLIFNDNNSVHAALFKGSNIMSEIVK
jgi:uncharacterized secreted protein with C-terminal beta-propeller domain